MQDHVHDGDDVGERLLFLAGESARLEGVESLGGEAGLRLHEDERFAQKARRAGRAVVNALTDLGLHHSHHGADELANPPFGGKERKEVQQNFPIRTGETAFLFLQHFIKMLKAGGRGGVVIKNTFLSNTDNASVSLRKLLLES
jgi:hypothetical protein